MNALTILFDNGVPAQLRRHLKPHQVTTSREKGWSDYQNGELLSRAQHEFDLLITTDSNLQYQQRLPDYDIAIIVLRAFKIQLSRYLPMVPAILERIETLAPGEIVYIYENDTLRLRDELKGKPHRIQYQSEETQK